MKRPRWIKDTERAEVIYVLLGLIALLLIAAVCSAQPARVSTWSEDRDAYRAAGTAFPVAVDREQGVTYYATARHVADDLSTPRVDGNPASVWRRSRTHDVAILAVRDGGRTDTYKLGDATTGPLTTWGYPGSGETLRTSRQTFTATAGSYGYSTGDSHVPGESGGPVFQGPTVVGVVSRRWPNRMVPASAVLGLLTDRPSTGDSP